MSQVLYKFLTSQKLIIVATNDENNKPWIFNAYYSIDKNLRIFFVSPEDSNHSIHINKNPEVAFSVAWYNETDINDRKAIQGKGKCRKINNPVDVAKYLTNHYKYFPSWKDIITYDKIKNKLIESRAYIIEPTYIKYWDDELYGDDETKEFIIESPNKDI